MPCWHVVTSVRYGTFMITGRSPVIRGGPQEQRGEGSHRIAWQLANNQPVPDGLWILHKCDIKACVNHNHLYAGTPAQNRQDREERGRSAKGTENGRAKLNDDKVREMRRLSSEGMTGVEMAQRFRVTESAISKVILRQSWGHVT